MTYTIEVYDNDLHVSTETAATEAKMRQRLRELDRQHMGYDVFDQDGKEVNV